jgi:hypothetical protein
MKHLTRDEFVDLIESPSILPASRRRHLEECAACRGEADALRAALSLAEIDRSPEPSPLFWDHFSARVSNAVRNEPPVETGTASRWLTRAVPAAAVAAVALLLIATGVWRTTVHAPTAPALVQQVNELRVPPAPAVEDDIEGDEAWAVVRDAARDLEWDDANAAGITAHPGTIDDVAVQLTAQERVELARVVDEDLKKKGA